MFVVYPSQLCQKYSYYGTLVFPQSGKGDVAHDGKYFPQFENQGINPAEEYLKILHKHKKLAPNAMKGLSIPYRLFAK